MIVSDGLKDHGPPPGSELTESFERAALRHRFLTMVVTPYVLIATVAKPMHTLLTAAAAVGRN